MILLNSRGAVKSVTAELHVSQNTLGCISWKRGILASLHGKNVNMEDMSSNNKNKKSSSQIKKKPYENGLL
jgi:hypothetical protein